MFQFHVCFNVCCSRQDPHFETPPSPRTAQQVGGTVRGCLACVGSFSQLCLLQLFDLDADVLSLWSFDHIWEAQPSFFGHQFVGSLNSFTWKLAQAGSGCGTPTSKALTASCHVNAKLTMVCAGARTGSK